MNHSRYFVVVPETKGLSLEDVTSLLAQGKQNTSVNDDEDYESVDGFKNEYFDDHTDEKGRDIGDS